MPEITSGSNDDRRGTFRRRNGQVVEVPPRRAPRASRIRRDVRTPLNLEFPEPEAPQHLSQGQFTGTSPEYTAAYRSYWGPDGAARAHKEIHGTFPPVEHFIQHMKDRGHDITGEEHTTQHPM